MKSNRRLMRLLCCTMACCYPVSVAGAAEESAEPGLIIVAEAANPRPDTLPAIKVVQEKLWGKYYPMVSARFPNVPEFQCDSWCYESNVKFVDARAMDGGAIEMRHRDMDRPHVLVLTTITPEPGAITFEARVALDTEHYPDAQPPDAPPGLNLCWQLRHAPGFASAPDKYPEFVRRCFLFTDRGRTFLPDTDRRNIPVQTPEHEHNNPPWVQNYVGVWDHVPVTPPTAWAGYSGDRYLTPVIGAVSRDGKHLTAIANGSADSMAQAWHDCMHNNSKWLPENAPVMDRRWRVTVFAMDNDPQALLERVAEKYPSEKRPVASATPWTPKPGWKAVATRAGWLEIPDHVTWMKSLPMGPFVRLADGGILGIDETNAIVSHDEGATWESRPLFTSGENLEVRPERAMLRTANGTIVLVLMNENDQTWGWDADKSLPKPGTRLPVWAIRSTDDGKTWTDAQMIYDGYCGDIHHMIQTKQGTIIAPVQELMYEDGRHALRPRYSKDEGKTWHRSNLLDIGGRGHHDGLIEPTLAELAGGRIWMLCRTNLGQFWSAISENEGEDFRTLQPSGIPASTAPGTLTRLASGRLMVVWNRPMPDGASNPPEETMIGGDRQWSDERVSNYRAELSASLSEDDGKTWSKPVVVVRRADSMGASLAYTYVFEAKPGELWLTTMQGDVRIAVSESALLKP